MTEEKKELLVFINSNPALQSLLYDLNLLPEECSGSVEEYKMFNIAKHFQAVLADLAEANAKLEAAEMKIALYQEDAERIWALMPELRYGDAHYEIHEAVHEKLGQLMEDVFVAEGALKLSACKVKELKGVMGFVEITAIQQRDFIKDQLTEANAKLEEAEARIKASQEQNAIYQYRNGRTRDWHDCSDIGLFEIIKRDHENEARSVYTSPVIPPDVTELMVKLEAAEARAAMWRGNSGIRNKSGCCCKFEILEDGEETDTIISLCAAHKDYLANLKREERNKQRVDDAKICDELYQGSDIKVNDCAKVILAGKEKQK